MQNPIRPYLAASLLLLAAARVPAQSTLPPAEKPATQAETAAEAAKKKAAAAQGGNAKEEAILLTAFEVSADASDTYEATNTNSVTGTNTPLSKTPLDAKVFNRQLMDELNVVDMTEMLTKFGGLGPAVINAGEDVRGMLEGDRQDPKSMTMRGLQINNPRRDGFLRSDTTLLDSFDIERVEAIGGSNSLLFGSGDAGGVITSASKRAYLNRRPTVTLSAIGDSEGSRRYTVDAQAGDRRFALRLNGVKANTLNFRPGLRQQTRGYQIAVTFQPWKRLQIRGEFRDYQRDTIFAQTAIIRAPAGLTLDNGTPLDNIHARYLVAFPEAPRLTGGVFDLTTVDSPIGALHRDAYFNQIKSVVAEMVLAEGLALQVRYGHDSRVNDALRASTTTIFAPNAPGNGFLDPATGRLGTAWAMNQTMVATPFWTGARGYRAALAYQKDLRRWGRHQASVFRQDMDSWTNQQTWRFYEVDANGVIIQNRANITNAESGRIVMPTTWMPIAPKTLIGGKDWRTDTVLHPNGRTYHFAPQIYSGAVTPTAGNPMGLSGAINATTGQSSNTSYFLDDTQETSTGASLFSEWWRGRVDTMLGYRAEKASTFRNNTNVQRGPISYDSLTAGTVIDTPVRGLRVSANYSTNAKINFDTTRDIFNEQLPIGRGVSKDIGLKFDLFERRVSGNLNYYQSEGQNFVATVPNRDDIDPPGINGRNGGNGFTYSKSSDGFNVTLTSRPLRGWEVRVNFATANGREKTNVTLPQFYNDQFNTTVLNGQQVVGVRANATAAAVPLMVPTDPRVPTSPQIPLSLAMLRDPNGPYSARLDPESGWITNAATIGLNTPGVGTNVTGLPITDHQLGFVSPSGGTLVVRRAGEMTAGYPERSYSFVNRYQFSEGRLRGLILGLSTSYQTGYRSYYYVDAADAGVRKMFYFPDRFTNDFYAVYSFYAYRRIRTSFQINVANLFDENRVVYLKNQLNGNLRYAQWFNAPRKLTLTTRVTF
jgi:outer membrane receptor protein involved in Fe transport